VVQIKILKAIKVSTIIFGIFALIGIVFNVGMGLFLRFQGLSQSTSVGIIGGADGPTAIYLASNSGFPLFTIIATILTVIGILKYNSLKKKL